mmetsp:Transcript_20369/g.38338  ORF Transcript_20369/g.38338 Transcript_20369/m.38338 type:complete len:109 (-) Transcript_20369:214-540(-)
MVLPMTSAHDKQARTVYMACMESIEYTPLKSKKKPVEDPDTKTNKCSPGALDRKSRVNKLELRANTPEKGQKLERKSSQKQKTCEVSDKSTVMRKTNTTKESPNGESH